MAGKLGAVFERRRIGNRSVRGGAGDALEKDGLRER
jgi:hypothetical protein